VCCVNFCARAPLFERVAASGGAMATLAKKRVDDDVQRKTLFVGALSKDAWSEPVLQMAFLPFGPIVAIKLGKPGTAFVTFHSHADADEARFNMDGADIAGSLARVQAAADPNVAATLMNPAQAVWALQPPVASVASVASS